jgi:hypothetical protein
MRFMAFIFKLKDHFFRRTLYGVGEAATKLLAATGAATFLARFAVAVRRCVAVTLPALCVIAALSSPAQAQPMPEGTLGWRALTGVGTYEFFADPESACLRMKEIYAPRSEWVGIVWGFPSAGCRWNTAIGESYPIGTRYYCASGWTMRAAGHCVIENETMYPRDPSPACAVNDPFHVTNPSAGNPVEIATGRKFQLEIDYETADGLLRVARNYSSVANADAYVDKGVLRLGGLGWAFDFGPTIRFATVPTAPNTRLLH